MYQNKGEFDSALNIGTRRRLVSGKESESSPREWGCFLYLFPRSATGNCAIASIFYATFLVFFRIVVIITTVKIEDYIREQAFALGFGAVGFARITPSRSSEMFQQWLDDGFAAEMSYLKRHAALRSDPRRLEPSAKSIIVVAARYPSEQTQATISNFARGADYHHVLKIKLAKLSDALAEKCGGANILRICVDSDPLSEREWAVRAGLGWIGRQGGVISPDLGACFFIGELLVNLEIEPSAPMVNRCGDFSQKRVIA